MFNNNIDVKKPLNEEEQASILSNVLAELRNKAEIDVEKATFKIPGTWVYRGLIAVMVVGANLGIWYLSSQYPSKDEIRKEYVSLEYYANNSKALIASQNRIESNQDLMTKNLQAVNETLATFRAKLENDVRQDRQIAEVETRTDRQIDEIKRRVERLETERK